MRSVFRVIAVLGVAMAAVFAVSSQAVAQNISDGEAYAVVWVCDDAACEDMSNVAGMEGAVISSIDASGAEIDNCAVETFASGMDGCVLTMHDGTGSYSVEFTSDYADYSLVSEAPEVLESESHGTQMAWYAAPAGDAAPPVSEVPSVGVGVGEQSGLLAVAAFGIAMMAIGATALRKYGEV